MSEFPTGGNEPGKRLKIAALRAARPEVDAELTDLENSALQRIELFGWTGMCHGVEIAHEGTWALALSGRGRTTRSAVSARTVEGLGSFMAATTRAAGWSWPGDVPL